MDFKEKFKSFIEDSKTKLHLSPTGAGPQDEESFPGLVIPPEGASEERRRGQTKPVLTDSEREVSQLQTDPIADQETLAQVYAEYFNEDFDPSYYELERLPSQIDLSTIDKDRKQLLKQLTVVSTRVFKLILERQSSCSVEMEHVVSVQADLLDAMKTCRTSRTCLARAQRQFVNSSLGILAGCRRRQQAMIMLENLTIMRTIQETDLKLQQLLADEMYPEAIRVLLECQTVASNYRHFHALRQLSSKLQDTLVMAEEQLDVALAKVCTNFNSHTYSKIQEAYKMLGKTQTAMDQLLMHLTTAIHNRSWNLVHCHAALTSNANIEELAKRPYPELCQTLTVDLFLPCLIDLCKSLWDIMLNYRKIFKWHKDNDSTAGNIGGDLQEADQLELQLQRQYVEKKLQSGLTRIWQDVQTKVRVLVLASNLSEFSIDLFIQFLNIIHTIIEVGQDFTSVDGCGPMQMTDTLQESLQKQCLAYFNAYHLSRMEELKVHLENEVWALCPVRQNFSLRHLAEFTHLRSAVSALGSPVKRSATLNGKDIKEASQEPDSPKRFFHVSADYWEDGTPFDDYLMVGDGSNEDDILMDGGGRGNRMSSANSDDESEEDDLSDEQKLEIMRENEGAEASNLSVGNLSTFKSKVWIPPPRKEGVCIANTTLLVLRFFGRYSHLAKLLYPIADHILAGIAQVFQYYIFSVYTVFATDKASEHEHSDLLKQFIMTIKESIILPTNEPSTMGLNLRSPAKDEHLGLDAEHNNVIISPIKGHNENKAAVDNIANNNSFSMIAGQGRWPAVGISYWEGTKDSVDLLSDCIVGVESCIYLADQLALLQSQLADIGAFAKADTSKRPDPQWNLPSPELVRHLRTPVYFTAALKSLIQGDQVLNLMSRVSWDIKEVQSQHSNYVDVILGNCQAFHQQLDKTAARVPVSRELVEKLWSEAVKVASKTFVEGFSAAKKCTNEGRALMQLDYRQFVLKMEKICKLKPIPYQDYVSNYIKAYYIPESELESWVQDHQEYTPAQLVALVNSVAYSNNKTRQKLNSLIADLSNRIRR